MKKKITAFALAMLMVLTLLPVTAGAAPPVELTVTFDSNGSGGTDYTSDPTNNDMKSAVDAALTNQGLTGTIASITKITVTGSATEITQYNWRYLLELFCSVGGASGESWAALTALDLSGMASLTEINNDTGSYYIAITRLHTLALPSGVAAIGESAFSGCTSLALTSLPSGLTTIGNYAFRNCTSLALTSLPSGLTTIGNYAFLNCVNLALTSLPSGVAAIGDGAFFGCTSLALTSLPSGVAAIGASAFNGCTGLTSMTFPADLGSIGNNAFFGCSSLARLIFTGGSAPSVGAGAFSSMPVTGTLYYPASANYSTVISALPSGWTLTQMATADNFTALKIAIESASVGDDIVISIMADIPFNDTITIDKDINITLVYDSSGYLHVLQGAAGVKDMFTILDSAGSPSNINVSLSFYGVTIDGQNTSRAILFGQYAFTSPSEGSLSIDGAVIKNCRATDNPLNPDSGLAFGGGIYAFTANGNITITNSVIRYCAAIGEFEARGGGLYCELNGTLTIDGTKLLGNEARATDHEDAMSYGGGLYAAASIYPGGVAAVDISDAEVIGNFSHTPYCDSDGEGGGIYHNDMTGVALSGDFSIANSTFSDNRAEMGYYLDPLPDKSGDGGVDWQAWHDANITTTTYTVPFVNALSGYDIDFEGGGGHRVTFDYKDAAQSNRSFWVYDGAKLPPIINIIMPPDKSNMSPVSWADGTSPNAAFDFVGTAIVKDYIFVPAMRSGGGGDEPPIVYNKHDAYLYGYPDKTVQPDSPITRAEAAALFFRVLEDENKHTPATTDLTDVFVGAWYYQEVAYLENMGAITGYPDGTFRANNNITRAEFAAIAARFAGLATTATNVFPDVPDSFWAAKYINGAAAKKWVEGYPDGMFKPANLITRAEAVAIINRMLERKIELSDIPANANKFRDINSRHWAYADIIEASFDHEFTRKPNGFERWR